ncbi:MAG: hypothetical protein MJ132_03780 [Clostridia bacterium]|nr:hypothetical protein [Clostridia bacterium]
MLTAKPSAKFYVATALLLSIVAIGWYGLCFLNANRILMEDDTPMDSGTKLFLTVAMGLVVLSWSISLVTLVRAMLRQSVFQIDEKGIHHTAMAKMIFAFIFVIPVKTIPFEAIQRVTEENGMFAIQIDKSKIDVTPFFKPFVSKEYHCFAGFTKENQEAIKEALNDFGKKY